MAPPAAGLDAELERIRHADISLRRYADMPDWHRQNIFGIVYREM